MNTIKKSLIKETKEMRENIIKNYEVYEKTTDEQLVLSVTYVGKYEEVVAREALQRGVQGVVCGHIHCAEIRQFDTITYYNDGDWVESCTALTEAKDGTMSIIDWAARVRDQAAKSATVAA